MYKEFLNALFDLSFDQLVTMRIVRGVYVALIAAIAFIMVIFVAALFGQSISAGFVGLILSPAMFILGVTVVRLWLETLMVLFRIADNTRRLADNMKPGVTT